MSEHRHTARGIVMHKGNILLIERWRDNLHYFSIPGGGIEPGESPEQTVVREIMEESSIEITVQRQVYRMDEPDGSVNYIYLCLYVHGEPALDPRSNEARNTALGKNRFKPRWVPLDQLSALPFMHWEPIHRQLVVDVQNGFAEDIKILVS